MDSLSLVFSSLWDFISNTCPLILDALLTPFSDLFAELQLGWFGDILSWLLNTVGIGQATPLTLILGVSIAIFIVRPIVIGFVSLFR